MPEPNDMEKEPNARMSNDKQRHEGNAGAYKSNDARMEDPLPTLNDTTMDGYWSRAAWLLVFYYYVNPCTYKSKEVAPPWEQIYFEVLPSF